VEWFVDNGHGTPLAQLSLSAMLVEVTAILRPTGCRCPPHLAL